MAAHVENPSYKSGYVTHDQVEAMTLADKIGVLSAGNVEQAGIRTASIAHRRTASSRGSSVRRG